jgi:hypothetical protein
MKDILEGIRNILASAIIVLTEKLRKRFGKKKHNNHHSHH